MKKVLVKTKIITKLYKEAVRNELGEVIEMGTQEQFEAGELIDQSGETESQEEIDFFISQRPQYVCEVIDITSEVEAQKAKEDKKKNFSFKGNTIAALRNELNEWLEMQK